MIKTADGRSRSERTPEEEVALLRRDIESLSDEERETLDLMIQEMSADPDEEGRLVDVLADAEYKRPLVDIETFVRDEYYLGKTCDNLYPQLLSDLTDMFSGGYHEVVLTGSIGYGKTFLASIGICRILYELSCMRTPHKSFGLAVDSNISIVNLSVNEMLAMKVVFENIASKIKASPYFEEFFSFEVTKKELRFPGNIWVAARASTDNSVLGLNVIASIVDETNFLPRNRYQKASHARWNHYDKAESLYAAIKRRMKSRFERNGKLPGMLFIVSSKKTSDDFTARRIRESESDPAVFVRDYALWEVKPEEYYSSARFWVLVGNEHVPSKMVENDEELQKVRASMPEGAILIDVPEDFRNDFERDLEGAIRDIAGCATVAVSPFINRREKIDAAIDRSRPHPFSSLTYDMSKGGTFLWDRMVGDIRERSFGIEAVRKRPKVNSSAPRHIHIDPSLRNDATGFCMAHIGGWKDVERRSEDGHQYVERAPVYVVDLILRVVPPIGGEILLGDMRRMVYDLAAHGYMVTYVTLDSYQSADSIQQLNAQGYKAALLSVDMKPDPYLTLKMALYEERVFFYEYPPLLEELRTLEWDGEKRKVDHPVNGSKDVADALAGCLYSLSQEQSHMPIPILPGIGYHGQDSWLPEQRQAVAAGNLSASFNRPVIPPFLVGSDGDDWGGGWNPGSV